jgi:hypothetical protein
VQLIRSWGSFLAGDQAGDRGQDRVQVFASAEVSGQARQVFRWLMPCSTRIRVDA